MHERTIAKRGIELKPEYCPSIMPGAIRGDGMVSANWQGCAAARPLKRPITRTAPGHTFGPAIHKSVLKSGVNRLPPAKYHHVQLNKQNQEAHLDWFGSSELVRYGC